VDLGENRLATEILWNLIEIELLDKPQGSVNTLVMKVFATEFEEEVLSSHFPRNDSSVRRSDQQVKLIVPKKHES